MKVLSAFFCVLTVFTFSVLPALGQDESAEPRPLPLVKPFYYTEAELAVWNDPKFQQRFIESYLSETEIEPTVTPEETIKMQEVLALLQPPSEEDEQTETKPELTEEQKQAQQQAKEEAEKAQAIELAQNIEAAVDLLHEYRIGGSAVFDFTLGNIHFQREEFNQAILAYEEAISKHAKFRRAWRNLAMIYVRQGKYDKAVPTLIRVVELGGGDGVLYGLLGYAHSMTGNDLSAESAYRRAVLLDPNTVDWKMGLALSFFKQKRYSEAVALCGMLIEDDTDNADLWLLQANAFIGLNRPLKAAENYELVDKLGKSTAPSLNMLGDIYVNEEVYGEAVACYVSALEKDPKVGPDRIIRAAKVLTARGANEETKTLIAKVEELLGDQLDDKDRKELLKLSARLAMAEGQSGDYVKIIEEIVKIDPLDGDALILLGQNYEREEDYEKAVFYFERAAAIENFEADAKMRHGQLLVRQQKYSEALPLLRRSQSIKPRERLEEYIVQVERVAKSR